MWLSATNADNIYGSDIVRSVRQTLLNPPPDQKQLPDMILTPLDSRNFPEQGEGDDVIHLICLMR